MEYQELIEDMALKSKYTKREIRKILRLLGTTIRDAMGRGRDVQIYGLGRFKNVRGGARSGRNAFTGELVPIPAKNRVRFRPCKALVLATEKSKNRFEHDDLEQRFKTKKKEE